jgi:predicted dehydrogenase/threonine dehydrogenase-like Zn-dependent dehydrogenase
MDQLTQKLKSGEMRIREVPLPSLSAGMVLVRNHYSVISAGTEGSTVKTARKSLIGKARERPQQVKQVLDVLKRQGPVQTYRAVMKKLDAYSPLGYSSAGEVLAVGEDVTGFGQGDLVACAGAGYANHAEVVAVPINLCVKLSPDADLRTASYNTLGAIALQGIRQADLRLGESCAVIGLGLLGQLTCLMLRAGGVRTYGIDVDRSAVATAAKHCCDDAWPRDESGLADRIAARTDGLGVDAVIITAATSDLDPINFAGQLARKKGRIVVVGAVPTGFDREPDYYRKELELRMSCSYGPGRYDLEYEEKGNDYPAAYVRWTENRNMRAFQHLLQSGQIQIDYLTTHEFPLEKASEAYEMIVRRSEPFLGILLRYDLEKPLGKAAVRIRDSRPAGKVGIAFIGAGSYAQGNLLPNLPRDDRDVVCRTVMTSSGTTSRRVAERFGFERCTSDEEDIFAAQDVNTVFIATRHDSHARYVRQAIQAGKHVFVEKPLCLNEIELEDILQAHQEHNSLQLMVGFNRRFAPLTGVLKSKLGGGPMAMSYRVNAGAIPAGTWIQDPAIGGGRIVGEVCHFVDFLTFLCGSLPTLIHAAALPDPDGLNDTVNINLQFANGSIGTVSYFSNGSKSLAKEYVEVYQSGRTGILRDFKELEIHGSQKPFKKKLITQDKGQARMVNAFVERVKSGGPPLIALEELARVTQFTFAAQESLTTRQAFGV